MNEAVKLADTRDCTGCGACVHICSKKAIGMVSNSEGFLYPKIALNKCVKCGKCSESCHILNSFTLPDRLSGQLAYAGQNRNQKSLTQSSSGGAFVVFATYLIEQKSIIAGCSMDEGMNPQHICVMNMVDLSKLQGSKYMESDLNSIYSQLEKSLDSQRKVLFSGTPCQVAGLRAYLKKDYTNLLCIDIICHGVPSRKLFSNYISWLEKKSGEKVLSYKFRNKEKYGWGLSYLLETKTKTTIKRHAFDPYYSAFLAGTIYRESCYSCKYSNQNRVGDITIGDYWGIEKEHPGFSSRNGVSSIIINTQKGLELFDQVKDRLIIEKSELNKITRHNKNLSEPTKRPPQRDHIYFDFSRLSPDKFFGEYLYPKKHFLTLIKAFIPAPLRRIIKRYI